MVVKLGTLSVAGQGRNLTVDQGADEIDVTTYGSTDKEFIAGLVDRSATLQILDDDVSSAIRTAFAPGASGTLTWFPLGTASGKPKFTVGTAVVTGNNISYPYDGAVIMECSLRLSGAVTEGVAP